MSTKPTEKEPNIIGQVFEFNKEIIGVERLDIGSLDGNDKDWLINVLEEETEEFSAAHATVDQIDALCDLIYFAIGGMARMGLDEDTAIECFNAVHAANMMKAKGKKDGRIYDGVTDAIKPENFVSPEGRIMNILLRKRGN